MPHMLYGHLPIAPTWEWALLSDNLADHAAAKAYARTLGYTQFRVSIVDISAPNFTKTLTT